MDKEQPIDYKAFLEKLNLSDDKTSELLYDLYKYEIGEEKKDNIKIGGQSNG